jgi:hypothetical protein
MNHESNKWVYSYNDDPNKRNKYPVKEGDKIEWKRNGSRGSVKSIILGFSDDKPDYVFVQNWCPDWSQPYSKRAKVWIKKRSVLRVVNA